MTYWNKWLETQPACCIPLCILVLGRTWSSKWNFRMSQLSMSGCQNWFTGFDLQMEEAASRYFFFFAWFNVTLSVTDLSWIIIKQKWECLDRVLHSLTTYFHLIWCWFMRGPTRRDKHKQFFPSEVTLDQMPSHCKSPIEWAPHQKQNLLWPLAPEKVTGETARSWAGNTDPRLLSLSHYTGRVSVMDCNSGLSPEWRRSPADAEEGFPLSWVDIGHPALQWWLFSQEDTDPCFIPASTSDGEGGDTA